MSFLSKSLRGLVAITTLCYVSLFNGAVSAAEYRLIIADNATCVANGRTGPDCVIPASASSSSTTTSSTSTSSSSSSTSSTSSTNSNGDCVVTVWNPCSGASSSSSSSSSTSTTSTASTPPPSSTTTTTTPTASPTAVQGSLDFGSGGYESTGKTFRINVGNTVTSYPFSVVQGRWAGTVGIVPTSSPFPEDGSEVRMWWSRNTGGPSLGAGCSGNLGAEGFLYWDQTGELGYGCLIPNEATTLYLNVRLCRSGRTDTTCSSGSAEYTGAEASVFIRGTKDQR